MKDKEIIDMIEEVLEANLQVCKMIRNENLKSQKEATMLIVRSLKKMADNIIEDDKAMYKVRI
tara:strand:- start:18092 stop:18280 length:189 start_codon:yes stop_codon:yes gene_type:complete